MSIPTCYWQWLKLHLRHILGSWGSNSNIGFHTFTSNPHSHSSNGTQFYRVSFSTLEDLAWYLGWFGVAFSWRLSMCTPNYSNVVTHKKHWNKILEAHWHMDNCSNWTTEVGIIISFRVSTSKMVFGTHLNKDCSTNLAFQN
jgi:hypothetical protein